MLYTLGVMSNSEMLESDKEGNQKSSQSDRKIQRTLNSMLNQMQLSDEEKNYRIENFENVDVVKDCGKYLKCTKCNLNFLRVINKGDTVGIHPVLGVLMCDSCCDYYGDGNFSLDSEGEDKYCRWCGEGGTIFACSKCICGFCDVCISKHFGEKGLEEVEKDDDWICYFCNPRPLWYLRSICSLAKEAAKNKRDHIKNTKQGRSVKKKRRKIENAASDFSKSSSDSSSSSNSSKSSSNLKKKQPKRRLSKFLKTKKKEESSSSEGETDKHVSCTKKGTSKQQLPPEDATKVSSESDTKSLKKSKTSDQENDDFEIEKKRKFLQKLTSIWRLTQTITEVGFNSSRSKLKSLARSERVRTLEQLKKEHDDLKSCMNVLVSSLSTASNSVESIQEDLSFEMTKDETESFQSQEIKLKTFADKFDEESGDKVTIDSEEDSFRKELKQKNGGKKQRVREKRQSFKKKRHGSNKNPEEKDDNCELENKSKFSFSDLGSDKEEKQGDSEGRGRSNENDRVSCDESGLVKPLLKVKSFARMLDENVYDKDKGKREETPVVIDLYDIDTDESENEAKKKEPLDKISDKSLTSGDEKKTEDEPKKKESCVNGEQDKSISVGGRKDESISNKESVDFEKSIDDSTVTKKRTKDETKRKKKCGFSEKMENKTSDEDVDEKSSGEKSEDRMTETEVKRKRKKKSLSGKKKKSKKIEASSSSDEQEKECSEEREEKDKTKKHLSYDKSHKLESNSEKKDTAKEKVNENIQLPGDNIDGKASLEEVNDKTKEYDNLEKGDEEPDDDSEKQRKKNVEHSEDENEEEEHKETEKSEVQPKEFDEKDLKKKQGDNTASDTEDEDKKESSGSEKKKVAKSSSRNKSSGSDSTSEEEGHTKIKRRSNKKELKTYFEEYKRKRERFLKSSKENSEPESEKEGVRANKALDSSESENEKKETERKSKRQKKKRILASSDEENEMKKITSSEESEKENQNDKSDSEVIKPSSGESSSEDEVENKKRKRIRKKSSDSSEEESKGKKKRRQDSSSESSEDEKTEKRKKGRKNIKKILKKDSLQLETKEALKNESERKKRLKERQKLFEELFPHKEGDEPKQLILDFSAETKEPLVTVHKKLVKKLKPHQMKGVKFMWDNCFETVQKLEEESGSGCILAHCMGLGKTLQVITLVHTVMTHDLGVNTVLIVCPLSTVSNWIREFETWLEKVHTDPIVLYDLLKYKKKEERIFHLKDWHENGGVLVLSYDLFRNLTKSVPKRGKQKNTKSRRVFETALLDPGPDLIVCDEGHLLKNEDTALSRCMSRVKTSRRIVLTGTPLQNNLIEYHCMVQFVKPNILGTKKEFCNRFVNPINNGQFEDSTELDVKIMKRRSHVLHSMLDGCIQRFDYSVLTPFLPEKQEYVLTIALTETQTKAYMHFIDHLSAKSFGNSRAASLFHDYHSLQRIWTHPRAMLMQSEKEAQKDVLGKDDEGSLKDFIVSSDEESEKSGSESSDNSVEEVVPKKRILRSNANDPELKKALEEEEKLQNKHWWDEFYNEKAYDDLRESNKLVVLFSLLKYCAQKKDKILVFSQSLYSLDLIEYFLGRINENSKKNDETLCGHRDTWELGSDYFRLDGSTNSDTRAMWCKYFNKESNSRARLFLISTKAGGLGINLYGANRVVIFDASWNPSHDLQSIFRVYRFGQKKPCYIYRFLAEATMEEKIYERQVTKLSLAHRVVDEHQIERHYTMGNLQGLYTFQPTPKEQRKIPKLPKDPVLADLLAEHKEIIVGYHEHDSLLENKQEEELSEEERKAAWKEYEEEKIQKAFTNPMLLPQGALPQGMGMPSFNPALMNQGNMGQTFINPLYLQSNFPLDALQRGLRLGVTPLLGESVESYLTRIYNREAWMQVGVRGPEI